MLNGYWKKLHIFPLFSKILYCIINHAFLYLWYSFHSKQLTNRWHLEQRSRLSRQFYLLWVLIPRTLDLPLVSCKQQDYWVSNFRLICVSIFWMAFCPSWSLLNLSLPIYLRDTNHFISPGTSHVCLWAGRHKVFPNGFPNSVILSFAVHKPRHI